MPLAVNWLDTVFPVQEDIWGLLQLAKVGLIWLEELVLIADWAIVLIHPKTSKGESIAYNLSAASHYYPLDERVIWDPMFWHQYDNVGFKVGEQDECTQKENSSVPEWWVSVQVGSRWVPTEKHITITPWIKHGLEGQHIKEFARPVTKSQGVAIVLKGASRRLSLVCWLHITGRLADPFRSKLFTDYFLDPWLLQELETGGLVVTT